jgi:hypothetical protein
MRKTKTNYITVQKSGSQRVSLLKYGERVFVLFKFVYIFHSLKQKYLPHNIADSNGC